MDFIDLLKIEGKDENEKIKNRRKYLEEKLGIKLENVSRFSFPLHELVGKNIENPIGVVQVPVGIAGPLLIHGNFANGKFYIPLATTEGALVASINRGAKAITKSNGVTVRILRKGMSRSLVFKLKSLEELENFFAFIDKNFEKIKEIASEESKHLKLLKIEKFAIGNKAYLRFVGDTGDAMGMNMLTIACSKIADFIQKNFDAKLLSLSANLCVDKKNSAINFLHGRGRSVTAEALIKKEVVEEVFKISSKEIAETAYSKLYIGSAIASTIGGFNAHVANVIAAMFIALGQDVAQVVESSMAITSIEDYNGNLYASIYLPSLEVGSVGGGTNLPAQSELLSLLSCKGSGNADKLAEIIAAACLAGEINLIAALAKNELASAHERLGRGKK
ncbi:MAG: hydroxymethylglutaryl-CoA reductase [Candidatus Micrarchaeales archaeon]